MPLDPKIRRMLDAMEADGVPPIHTLSIEDARRQLRDLSELLGPADEVHRVEDRTIPGAAGDVPIRIYDPGGPEPTGALVYFHGGGWVVGDLETHDAYCRSVAAASGVTVVAVDYRLAPEHKYPAAVDDCFAATCWIAEHGEQLGIDTARIGVGGDSAGGNLAAVVTLLARDRGGPPLRLQLLLYPVADFSFDTESYEENADGFLLTRDAMRWFWDLYLPDAAAGAGPSASPLRAGDLSNVPPALVITAQYDPLRDDGQAYADRLRAAGVPVDHTCYGGVIHGFCRQTNVLQQARDARDQVADVLRTELGSG